ncbi:hypothetical protein CPB83DRAFT_854131 [Crepidotus variabilis]|uniref:BHLH domain-containing protein n=1 Tax=Crepidotus variabilis TaxID=179855 RepID=A0A9P6EFP8_9AGAR|nr:hypothetical protein CPB83DRAFT_854131 [Crepidotus variabilis]
MALISGKPSSINLDAVRQAAAVPGPSNDTSFSGLPTPAPSGEIRPQNEFMSPMMNGYMEPLPHSMISSSSLQHQAAAQAALERQLQELARQQQQQQGSNGYPPSPSSFHQTSRPAPTSPTFRPHSSSATTTAMSSPMHLPMSPMHLPASSQPTSPAIFGSGHGAESLNAFDVAMFPPEHSHRHNVPNHSQSNSSTGASTPLSAPERIAFNVYNNPSPNAETIPNLTINSPLVDGTSHPNRRRRSFHTSPEQQTFRHNFTSDAKHHQSLSQPAIMDQDISPLTSPWLGASPPGPTASNPPNSHSHPLTSTTTLNLRHKSTTSIGGNSNKRTAPPSDSGDESSNPNPRKRQSPAIRPMLTKMSSVGGSEDRNGLERGEMPGISDPRGRSGSPTSTPNSNYLPPPLTMSSALRSGHRLPPFSPVGTSASNVGSTSPLFTSSSGPVISKKAHRNSKSTTSTPLLRGSGSTLPRGSISKSTSTTRHGSGSSAGTNMNSDAGIQDSPSPVDLNGDVIQDNREFKGTARENDAGKEGMDKDQFRGSESGFERDRRVMPPPPVPSTSTANKTLDNQNGSRIDAEQSRNIDMESFSGMINLDFGMGGMNSMQMQQDDRFDMSVEMSMNMGELGLTSPISSMGMNNMNSVPMGGLQMGDMGDMESFNMMNLPMEFGMGTMGFSNDHEQRQAQALQDQSPTNSTSPVTSNQRGRDSRSDMQNMPAPDPQQSMPATPASMLNLGRLGRTRLKSDTTNTASRSLSKNATGRHSSRERLKEKEPSASPGAGAGGSTKTRAPKRSNTANLVSPGLKPIRPAPNTGPTPFISTRAATSGSTNGITTSSGGSASQAASESVIRQPKRTHRDAEQRRRNSQKQVIDELRRLLPPISQPTNSSNPDDIPAPTFIFQSTHAPLLPGGLPPRGPPKAGADGPNKNVSKLQVLLCGNEFIKVLTKRVVRRDDEIDKLRREVRRLRSRADGLEESEDVEEEFDLERDLDEIERSESSTSEGTVGNLDNQVEEGMEDEDEDADD